MEREYIENLIDRYIEGETSDNEEAELHDFFTRKNAVIPEEWRFYKALFAFENEEKAVAETRNDKSGMPRKARRKLIWSISIAASVIILASIFISVPKQSDNYAIIDGKKVTDQAVVMEEAKAALMMVSTTEDESFEALNEMQ